MGRYIFTSEKDEILAKEPKKILKELGSILVKQINDIIGVDYSYFKTKSFSVSFYEATISYKNPKLTRRIYMGLCWDNDEMLSDIEFFIWEEAEKRCGVNFDILYDNLLKNGFLAGRECPNGKNSLIAVKKITNKNIPNLVKCLKQSITIK